MITLWIRSLLRNEKRLSDDATWRCRELNRMQVHVGTYRCEFSVEKLLDSEYAHAIVCLTQPPPPTNPPSPSAAPAPPVPLGALVFVGMSTSLLRSREGSAAPQRLGHALDVTMGICQTQECPNASRHSTAFVPADLRTRFPHLLAEKEGR